MKYLTTNEIRRKWLDFFKSKNHEEFESKSLIPKDDNSLLWINSGVATLKKYFSGKEIPSSNRITNSQRCIRTNDIENVGVTARHHTIFEMLGNFSIGDYFKNEAIEFAFELLTKEFEFDINKLYITVYKDDKITYDKWIELGILENHIIKCDKDRNFWDLGSGPCGPCTEIYYDRGTKYDPNNIGEKLFFEDIENDRYIEIWNIVFSEFNNINGEYPKLEKQNIDTGAGLERLASIFQDVPTDFDIDIFKPLISVIENYSEYKYDVDAYFSNDLEQKKINKNFRIIVDHFKASCFAIADGAIPSNKDRGYIIRKILRRAKLSLFFLKIKTNDLVPNLVEEIIKQMNDYYPYLSDNKDKIINNILKEFEIFEKTLSNVENLFKKSINDKKITGETLFHLVDTYGFPIELIKEIKENNSFIELENIYSFNDEEKKILRTNIKIDFDEFNKLFEEHKEISKSRNDVNSFDVQNATLLNLDIQSKFDYSLRKCKSKILKMFDLDFNEIDSITNNDCYVLLDKTCFYATSGGQVNDIGKIDNYFVIDVFKAPNGQHIHKVKNATLNINENVICKLKWNRRKYCTINHTTEHLIHSALKNIIDNNIKQEGAFKSDTKLTFDFQYPTKLTNEQIREIENYIDSLIKKEIDIEIIYTNFENAKKMGALGYFEDVYKKIKGDLRVVKIGDSSIELCGGTHLPNTKYIDQFKILKCESKGSGSWRIEAITTSYKINKYIEQIKSQYLSDIDEKIENLKSLNLDISKLEELKNNFLNLFNDINENFKEIIDYKSSINNLYQSIMVEYNKNNEENEINLIKEKFIDLNDKYIVVNNFNQKSIQLAITELMNEHQDRPFFLFNEIDDKLQYYAGWNKNTNKLDFSLIIKEFNTISNGKGGGKKEFAQGGTSNKDSLEQMINYINSLEY